MALRLLELLVDRTAAQAAQLMIEYDPQPPFDCGAVAKCNDDIVNRVIEYAQLRKYAGARRVQNVVAQKVSPCGSDAWC